MAFMKILPKFNRESKKTYRIICGVYIFLASLLGICSLFMSIRLKSKFFINRRCHMKKNGWKYGVKSVIIMDKKNLFILFKD